MLPAWTRANEIFFPIGNASSALLKIEQAMAVCRRCEVAEACLNLDPPVNLSR